MRLLVSLVAVLSLLNCAQSSVSAPARSRPQNAVSTTDAAKHQPYVLEPNGGEPFIFCSSPGLSVNIKVSPATTGGLLVAMGAAELIGSNSGTHRGEDEIIYFLSGTGSAFVGERTVRIQPGVTMYVPRGTRHGFTSEGSEPVKFVWVISPPGLEDRFRIGGHPPSYDCSIEKK